MPMVPDTWIGMKYRMITKAARSLPVNFPDVKHVSSEGGFVVRKYSIPPSLFINIDETGVCLLSCQKRTWGPSGAKQIFGIGWGDKMPFTVLPAISADGK